MATTFLGVAVGVVVMTAAVSYGCASRPASVGTTQLTSARVVATAPVVLAASNTDPIAPAMEREQQATATAVLVVRGDVATRCLGASDTFATDRAGWRVVLEKVTTCMKTGALRGQRLTVSGDAKERAAVRCVLSKMGIAGSRVDLQPSTDAKIELRLSAGPDVAPSSSLTLPIDRSDVVAFLSDDNLD
ncbi:MAG: hypothetical protein JWM74_269 [Myxococcaceae bacterium]|nr:hypothetical protein [Myxococcaceae bacterium]